MHSTGDKVSKVEKESDSFTGAAHFGQEQIPERALLCLFARVCVCVNSVHPGLGITLWRRSTSLHDGCRAHQPQ